MDAVECACAQCDDVCFGELPGQLVDAISEVLRDEHGRLPPRLPPKRRSIESTAQEHSAKRRRVHETLSFYLALDKSGNAIVGSTRTKSHRCRLCNMPNAHTQSHTKLNHGLKDEIAQENLRDWYHSFELAEFETRDALIRLE